MLIWWAEPLKQKVSWEKEANLQLSWNTGLLIRVTTSRIRIRPRIQRKQTGSAENMFCWLRIMTWMRKSQSLSWRIWDLWLTVLRMEFNVWQGWNRNRQEPMIWSLWIFRCRTWMDIRQLRQSEDWQMRRKPLFQS